MNIFNYSATDIGTNLLINKLQSEIQQLMNWKDEIELVISANLPQEFFEYFCELKLNWERIYIYIYNEKDLLFEFIPKKEKFILLQHMRKPNILLLSNDDSLILENPIFEDDIYLNDNYNLIVL